MCSPLQGRTQDDIPRLLRGLQHIYTIETLREAIFAILAGIIYFPVLPKKGKRCADELPREHDPRFVRLRRRH